MDIQETRVPGVVRNVRTENKQTRCTGISKPSEACFWGHARPSRPVSILLGVLWNLLFLVAGNFFVLCLDWPKLRTQHHELNDEVQDQGVCVAVVFLSNHTTVVLSSCQAVVVDVPCFAICCHAEVGLASVIFLGNRQTETSGLIQSGGCTVLLNNSWRKGMVSTAAAINRYVPRCLPAGTRSIRLITLFRKQKFGLR